MHFGHHAKHVFKRILTRTRRRSDRVPVCTDVMLSHPSRGLVRGRLRDANERGVFVETDMMAPKTGLVKVTFSLPNAQGGNEVFTFNTRVAHIGDGGIGLAFIKAPIPIIRALTAVLDVQHLPAPRSHRWALS